MRYIANGIIPVLLLILVKFLKADLHSLRISMRAFDILRMEVKYVYAFYVA